MTLLSASSAAAVAWPREGLTTDRISIAADGTQADSDSLGGASISADGRYVAFASAASNLLPGGTPALEAIYVSDRLARTVTRISGGLAGAEPDSYSEAPTITPDGRYVAFMSDASNLVPGDTNGHADAFVSDRTTGTLTRVSVATDGTQGDNVSRTPSISADGRYVVFESFATNLVTGDTNGGVDVFLADRQTATMSRISVGNGGVQANGDSWLAAISADGGTIAFSSFASNLVAGDGNGHEDVFVADRISGVVSRVSVSSTGTEGNANSDWASISSDGRYVAYSSSASNLVANDTNGFGARDVFVTDRNSAAVTRVNLDGNGAQANGDSGEPQISADGRFVAYTSSASALVPGDTNGDQDAFVVDRTTGAVTLVSVGMNAAVANSFSAATAISADGRSVVFFTDASNIVPGDTGGWFDVFVRNLTGVPGAPTSVSATAGAGVATITWGGASNGGSAITGYTATASPGGAACTTTATSCVIPGLTNGAAYTVTITATNALGTGAASAASPAVVPVTTPGAPTGVAATVGAGSATVTWIAPVTTGGTPVTSYTAVANPGGASCTTTTGTSCTVSGLTNGTAYTFTVTASNAVGAGAASAPSPVVMPATTPGAPGTPIVLRGDRKLTVSWTAPSNDGGSPVTSYTATASPGGATCSTSTTSCALTGLVNGTKYTVTVVASNAAGVGVPSLPSAPIVAAGRPGQPGRVAGMRGHLSVVVNWSAAPANGTAVTQYRVVASPGGRACITGALRCTVTGLVDGRSYRLTVTATNAVGAGLPSAYSPVVVPAALPGVPATLRAVRGNGRATLSWTAPAANGTAAISGYRVVASPGGANCTTTGALQCTIAGLVNGRRYIFTVSAINRVGAGPGSVGVAAVPATVPGPVRALAATFPAAKSTMLTWSAPSITGGLAITRYEFRVSADNGKSWARWTAVGTARTATLVTLNRGRTYLVQARALNMAGPGSAATLSVRPTR